MADMIPLSEQIDNNLWEQEARKSKQPWASEKKPSNPKDSVGIKKVYFSVLPWGVLAEVGLAMLEGALKYGRHNYRGAGVRASVYFDASIRHLTQWWEGEDIDQDSQLSHITKAIASLTVLRDSMLRENWSDDRPPKMQDAWVQDLNKKAAALVEKYPEPAKVWMEKPEGREWNPDWDWGLE